MAIEPSASAAAKSLRRARALVVTAGAGMGVDSGLPDFRRDQGFWKAYPPYQRLGISFVDAAETMRAQRVPRCPRCGAVSRPNTLMFGDWAWVADRSHGQRRAFEAWLEGREPSIPAPHLSLAVGALEGLRAIDAALRG
jgi:NAD-dependent SIR2 family protein deacetylase